MSLLSLLNRTLDDPLPAAEVKGVRAVRQGFHDYSRGTVVEGRDPRGFRYYWFGLQAIEGKPALAAGEMSEEELADWFRQHCSAAEP